MSEVKALEKLRGLPFHGTNGFGTCVTASKDTVNSIADEIEAEIERNYILLPRDADGVPIHLGDTLQLGDTRGKVVALAYCSSNGEMPWEWQCDTGDWYNTAFARHVEPRTLEDVLRDVWKEALDYAKSDIWRNPDEVFTERADEIRAMLGKVDHGNA